MRRSRILSQALNVRIVVLVQSRTAALRRRPEAAAGWCRYLDTDASVIGFPLKQLQESMPGVVQHSAQPDRLIVRDTLSKVTGC